MPLEQIRPVAALNSSESLRRQSYFDCASSSSTNNSPYPRDDAGSDSDREHVDDDGEGVYVDRHKRFSTPSRHSESMSLAKLGGVGGVTRSGSWSRNSVPESLLSARRAGDEKRSPPFKPHRSSLAMYQEDGEEEEDSFAASHVPSSLAMAGGPDRHSSDGDHQTSSAPSGFALPLSTPIAQNRYVGAPASSRTSTASSAAAFSLRSLSNRNSTGSVSSSASSIGSRGETDRLSPASPSTSSNALDPTLTAKSASDSTLSESSSLASATAPSSPVLMDEAVSNVEDERIEGNRAPHPKRDPPFDSSLPVADIPSFDQHQRSWGQKSAQTGSGEAADSPKPEASATSADTTANAVNRSNAPSASSSKLVTSPVADPTLTPSAEELYSTPTSMAFSPLVPRRHSGMIMIRSRSQLALHAGLAMTFANAEGGRAAARERARNQTGWENAPFSVLEAQRHARAFAASQPASPGTSATAVSWDPPAPAMLLQPAATVTEQASVRSPNMSPRPQSSMQSSPTMSPLAQSIDAGASSPRPRLPSRQKSDYSLSRTALARIDTVLGVYGTEGSGSSLPVSADAASSSTSPGPRPQPTRSPSINAIAGVNSLLRTPTTEEWSRFLESQGVGMAGRRSRTGTNLSTASSAQRGSRLALSSLSTSARAEPDAGADDRDDDSDMDSDDSDDHDLGVEVLEKLKQLGISRAASRAGSVFGDELASLDEEDEDDLSPVSPQVNKVLPQTDLTPLTPMASNHNQLPAVQVSPLAALHSSPSTPQAVLDRALTLRLPRSKRPTSSGEVHATSQLHSIEHKRDLSISDFEIVSDIGRGAYGLVKKARKIGADGRGQGDEVVIKYIIKSRILADCWRRHRVLGPIPVEIHVMDQLRRIAYVAPSRPRPWAPNRPKTLEDYRARKRQETEQERTGASMGPPSAAPAPTSHPNICRMLDFFEDHEFYYLVMPCFGRGQDLFDYVESAPDGLAASQCRSIFGQVADALWFLHANNIVHRDIKDENVVLDGQGNAQLIDFGSAAHVRPGKLFDTFSGTLDYAAAEILQGEKYAGQAQDVWALGVVGFVLLCGECPFWNGEEAVQGLEEGTRAAQTLKERCLIARGGPSDAEEELMDEDLDVTPLDPAWSPRKDKEGTEPDGGGRVDDFVDLISRCLELDPDLRPSAEQICQHRFLAGFAGWTGRRGWQRLKAPLVPSCTSTNETRGSIPAPTTSAAASAGLTA
ncbi:putative protein kinase [Pseudozyma hubeiensis]|nr:putative protein kinase [Pseudozyma hubeiensis]